MLNTLTLQCLDLKHYTILCFFLNCNVLKFNLPSIAALLIVMSVALLSKERGVL